MKKITRLVAIGFLAYLSNTYADDWRYSLTPQASYGSYGNSSLRKGLYGTGFFATADYQDQGGLTVGYNYTEVSYTQQSNIAQHGLFASTRWHFTPDALPGRLTLRLDGHYLTNNDPTHGSSDVAVFAPQLAFINPQKDTYFDVGYARSFYGNERGSTEKLAVNQWTATVGMGFNDNYDWLQFRGYVIDTTNKNRSQGKGETFAGNVKATHYFQPNAFYLHSVYVDGLFGERIFAVDNDAAAVFNLADVQKGAVAIGGKWQFTPSLTALVVGGYEQYKNQTLNDNYSNLYVYLNFSQAW
jgi:hypothetical protein